MGKLSCACLNVQIHCKTDPVPVQQSFVDDVTCYTWSPDQFFNEQLREVTLDLEGIHVEHPSLMCSRMCSSWRVYHCVNCAMFTHATNADQPDDERVLVSSKLLCTERAIEDCLCSADYSRVFKILLKVDSETAAAPLLELPSKDVEHQLDEIQKQLNGFLGAEETAMNERIRLYEETEREKYAELESKSRSDKNVMMARLLHAAYLSVSESLSEAMVESPVGSLMHLTQQLPVLSKLDHQEEPLSIEVGGEEEEDVEDSAEDLVSSLHRLQPVSRSSSTTKRSRSELVTHHDYQPGLITTDDVFPYDPGFQEDPCQPFSDSDEDVNDTDDSSLVDDGIQRSGGSHGSESSGRGPAGPAFSTSVPIDVPSWMHHSIHQTTFAYHDDETDAVTRDPARMAASIQALARSVHGNTSEIFGELPRPPTRFKTTSRHSGARH